MLYVSDYQKNVINYSYMSLTVKVQFKNKLYKLAQGTATLQQLQQQMKQRFPNTNFLKFYYHDFQVSDLSTVLAAAVKEGSSSVKLVAKNDSLDTSQLNEASKLAESQKHNQNISLLKENESKVQPKAKVNLPNQFFICYNCQGAKIIKSMSIVEICSICKGTGRLEQTHKFISRLRQLYLKHFRPIQQAQKVLEQKKKEQIAPRKGSFAGVDKNYQVIVRQITRKETVEVGTIFSMRFQIKNIGPSWERKFIEVMQMGQIQGKSLSALKTGETMEIELGPFICTTEGVFEKTYTLCYKQGDKLVRFGHKFGFSVKGFKQKAVKKNVSNQRERIRDLKMISGSSKSEQYISLKLKSMGIDVLNLQIEDQVIIDMIKQFK